VLVLLDQPVLAQLITLALGHGAYATRAVPTVAEALGALEAWQPHLALLDMDAGGGRVMEWIRAGAEGGGSLPAIALTRRGDLKTKLAAFEQGVDDILTVPFSPEELVARVLALMRRTYGEAVAFAPVITHGELEIDILHRRVRAGTSELHLTPLEQALLYLLAANADRVLTREEILDNLWGVDYIAESNVVDRHVRNLRAKLQNDWHKPRYVATVPGRGYRFLPVSPESPEGHSAATGPASSGTTNNARGRHSRAP
jgi:DNA-binding response OmpR family regulator